MKITDIIRGILDVVDQEQQSAVPPVAIRIHAEPEQQPEQEPDLLPVIQQLAGVKCTEPEYANEPKETVAPLKAAFPGGDDMHSRKDPSDIRTNAPSMYPGYQAGKR